MSKVRYLAEWIDGYDGDDDAEFDPTLYSIAMKPFETRGAAEAHAEAEADKGPCGGWWRVTQQVYDSGYYEPGVGDWSDIQTWVEGCEPPIRYDD